MARYLVMKRNNDTQIVKEEASKIVWMPFGDFIEELVSPHYERYDVRSIEYWDIDEESNDVESFERLWNFCGYSIDDFVGLFKSYDSYDGIDF